MLNIDEWIQADSSTLSLFEIEDLGDSIEDLLAERHRLRKMVEREMRQLRSARKKLLDFKNEAAFQEMYTEVEALLKSFRQQARELDNEKHQLEELLITQRVMHNNAAPGSV